MSNKCSDCQFWQRGTYTTSEPRHPYTETTHDSPIGECRKETPKLVTSSRDVSADFERYSTVVGRVSTYWPTVCEDAWCGEFCRKLTKENEDE